MRVTAKMVFLQIGRPCADLAKIKDFCSTRLAADRGMESNFGQKVHFLAKSAKLYFGAQFYFVLFDQKVLGLGLCLVNFSTFDQKSTVEFWEPSKFDI